jgi:hypothetical protein
MRRLKEDFPFYAANCMLIRSKAGDIYPLRLNRAQQYIHEKVEEQKARTGRVRALILKGRQQGCSTYVGARYYHQTTWNRGIKTFILTHEDKATANLFDMVNRYHDNCPVFVRPSTGAANAKELFFDKIDSGYQVGTAGNKAVGRSMTVQRFHGSEVAFWPNAESHAAGVLQAVPDEEGTEVILESTANGVGNYYHQSWQEAESGASDFIAIFVPWYWQDEYRKEPPQDFVPNEEERQYAESYGLDWPQIYWRRLKILQLKDPNLFKQEYPATAAEAFQMSGHDSYIQSADVVRARKSEKEPVGPLIIGLDPARFGNDSSCMIRRRGGKAFGIERKTKWDTMQVAGWAKMVIDKEDPARMFIDVGGIGSGVYDRLVEQGYGPLPRGKGIVTAVNFGSAPLNPVRYDDKGQEIGGGPANRRAEMWMATKDWLKDETGADIPDEDRLQADACGPGYRYDSNSRIVLESKEQMRSRGVASPDAWDALALTFAEPVAPKRVSKPLVFTSEFS